MRKILLLGLVLSFVFSAINFSQTSQEILPVNQVKPGMRGYGLTVFKGTEPGKFDAEIVEIIDGGFGEKIIVARISGGSKEYPLEETMGVAGMSGSPVYINGKKIGAVSLLFTLFQNDSLVGITPIESMLREGSFSSLGVQMLPMKIPLFVSGFSNKSLAELTGCFEKQGLNFKLIPIANAGFVPGGEEDNQLKSGSSIAVVIVRGDLFLGGVGTLTHIDGKKVYAFGHPFLKIGKCDFPFYKSEIATIISSSAISFKLLKRLVGSSPGSIKWDSNSALVGVLGETAKMIPVSVELKTKEWSKNLNAEVARFQYTPYLISLIPEAALDRYFQGDISKYNFKVHGRVLIKGMPEIRIDDIFAGFGDFVNKVEGEVLGPLFNSSFPFEIEEVKFDIELSDKEEFVLEKVWLSKNDKIDETDKELSDNAYPGEVVYLKVILRKAESSERFKGLLAIPIPENCPAGRVEVVVEDGSAFESKKKTEKTIKHVKNLEELIEFINKKLQFKNKQLFVQVVLPEPEELENQKESRETINQETKTEIEKVKKVQWRDWEMMTEDEKLPDQEEKEIKLVETTPALDGPVKTKKTLHFSIEKESERALTPPAKKKVSKFWTIFSIIVLAWILLYYGYLREKIKR